MVNSIDMVIVCINITIVCIDYMFSVKPKVVHLLTLVANGIWSNVDRWMWWLE